ncbi:hypothetical protein ACHAXN_000347 [Cyclotella atomus]
MDATISALNRKQCPKDSLLSTPLPSRSSSATMSTAVSPITWASTRLSKPSKTKLSAYKSLETEFIHTNLQPNHIHASLDRLKITYGHIPRRSLTWGPHPSSSSTSP